MFDLEDMLYYLRQCVLLVILLASCVAFGALGILFMYATDDTLSVLLWLALFGPTAAAIGAFGLLVTGRKSTAN